MLNHQVSYPRQQPCLPLDTLSRQFALPEERHLLALLDSNLVLLRLNQQERNPALEVQLPQLRMVQLLVTYQPQNRLVPLKELQEGLRCNEFHVSTHKEFR